MLLTTNNSREINNLFNELNAIFDDSDSIRRMNRNKSDYKTHTDDDGIILTIKVPGYNKKLIDVLVSGNQLIIEGKSNSGDTNGFKRLFTIDDNLDTDGIEATVVDGILTVSIPYAEEVKPRKIEVKVK